MKAGAGSKGGAFWTAEAGPQGCAWNVCMAGRHGRLEGWLSGRCAAGGCKERRKGAVLWMCCLTCAGLGCAAWVAVR